MGLGSHPMPFQRAWAAESVTHGLPREARAGAFSGDGTPIEATSPPLARTTAGQAAFARRRVACRPTASSIAARRMPHPRWTVSAVRCAAVLPAARRPVTHLPFDGPDSSGPSEHGDASVEPVLLRCLETRDNNSLAAVACAQGRMGTAVSVQPLLRAARNVHYSGGVRSGSRSRPGHSGSPTRRR